MSLVIFSVYYNQKLKHVFVFKQSKEEKISVDKLFLGFIAIHRKKFPKFHYAETLGKFSCDILTVLEILEIPRRRNPLSFDDFSMLIK